MNKTRLTLLAVATLAIGLFTGCTTPGTPSTPGQQATAERRAKRITEEATYDVTIIALKGKKNTAEKRQVFVNITNQLTGFLSETNIAAGDIAAYIKGLPIDELKTVEGQLLASGTILVIDEFVGDRIIVDGPMLKPVIESAIKGFGRGIQFAEANPYVPPPPKPPKPTNSVPAIVRP